MRTQPCPSSQLRRSCPQPAALLARMQGNRHPFNHIACSAGHDERAYEGDSDMQRLRLAAFQAAWAMNEEALRVRPLHNTCNVLV